MIADSESNKIIILVKNTVLGLIRRTCKEKQLIVNC